MAIMWITNPNASQQPQSDKKPRFRCLNSYLLKEISVPFGIGLALFFVVVAFAQVLKASDAATGLGFTGTDILRAFVYSLPPLLGLLIPVSLLFATLLGVGRLASDREVIGMLACGISPYRCLVVPTALGVFFALVCALLMAWGEPWGIKGLRNVLTHSAQKALASGVRAGEFHEWVSGVMFMAQKEKKGQLHEVVFADRREKNRSVIISAHQGQVMTSPQASEVVFDLSDGTIIVHDKNRVRTMEFEKNRYRLDVGALVRRAPRKMPSIMGKSIPTLWKESHDPSIRASKRAWLSVVLHRKVALPMATLIFALLAVPLALRSTSGARARGFLYSAAIVGIYYYLGRALELSARGGKCDPALAVWIPNLLGFVAFVFLFRRMRRSTL